MAGMDVQPGVALVISDVDGTLLDPEKSLSPGAPTAVRRLRLAGIRFTVASARPPRLTQSLLRDLHISEPSACFNGGLLIDPDCNVLHQLPMTPSDAQTVADYIRKSPLDLWVYTGTDWYVSNPSGPHVQHQEELMGGQAAPLRSYDMLQLHVLKLVGVSDDYDAVKHAQSELGKLCCVAISATRSSDYYLDVTHADANKGRVVLTLSKMLNIPTGTDCHYWGYADRCTDVSPKRSKHRHGQRDRRRKSAGDLRYEEQYGGRLRVCHRAFHPRGRAEAGRRLSKGESSRAPSNAQWSLSSWE